MIDGYDLHKLSNGMTLLGEAMDGVESVAFKMMLPAGVVAMPQGCCGASNVISDWIFRGAGPYTSRVLNEKLDGLGLHRLGTVGKAFLSLGAASEAGSLSEALDLFAEIVLNARLEDDQFELARQLAMDEIVGLSDDPKQQVMIQLKEQFFPQPWGFSTLGHLEDIEALTAARTRELATRTFDASQSIIVIAGKYDFNAVCAQMESLFGAQASKQAQAKVNAGDKGQGYTHIQNDGAQVHIALMTDSVTCDSPDYYAERLAISVLSGGMSSRLFTEVREKRGLCYAVGASYYGLKDFAGIQCYAGTTPDKAQETVDVILDQFRHLHENLTEDELDRAKVGLKSGTIMQSESSANRIGSIGSDYYKLGRVRSLDEIKAGIDAVTLDGLRSFLSQRTSWDFTGVSMGPNPISIES